MRNESRVFFFLLLLLLNYHMKIQLGDFDAHPGGKTHNKTDHVSVDKR